MEELLAQVITISSNFPQIERAAREAVDFLNVQHGLIRDPAYELREKCLFVIQLCLETRRTKFTAIAIAGLQKIIRDDRFHSSIEPENDSKWLPLQLLQATNCFVTLSDDTQVDILKIILNIACSKKWPMNGRTIISILCLCGEAFQSGNTSIRSAAQAAASQTLRSFCMLLEEEQSDCESDGCSFNEMIPVMQYICSRIDEADRSNTCEKEVVFYLECLLTLCSSLPSYVSSNIHLKTFLWQKLCPMLISVLGTPKIDKNIVTRNSGVEKEHGRGSGGLSTAPSHNSSHAKTIYCINAELVRLFGAISTLRPVLESLFHRVLLYPAPEHRLDALKAVAELFRNGNRIVDICGPLVREDESSPHFDLSLLRLIMDSIEESSSSTFLVMEASISCCFALLQAIQKMCLGECIPPNISETVIKMYPKLVDSEYKGPQTYQSTVRLPQQYRDTIEKENKLFDEIQSDNEEQESCNSDDSGDTEGPQEEEVDVEGSRESTDYNIESSASAALDVAGSGDDFVYFENTVRQGARHFFSALRELLPLLVPMRSSIQVDQSLQSFASQYCDGLMSGEESFERGGVKGEGFYLAVYSALLLDLRLWQSSNCYGSSMRHVIITEDEFVIKVKGIGLLTYLSSVWFRELYQLIVSSSLLQTYGYLPLDENSQPHALINLLTDVEGVGSYQKGCQMLWECRRLVKSVACEDHVERDVGLRLSRRILTCSWDTLLKVLAVPLYEKKSKFHRRKFRDLKFLRSEQHSSQMKHLITTSIDGLQILTKLCGDLGLQERCGSIIELLVTASCNHSGNTNNVIRLPTTSSDVVRLTPSHSLSLDLLLGSGLEIGSHCSDCWPHIFRCCVYVKKLEHKYFSKSENRSLGSTTVLRKNESASSNKNSSLTFDPQLEEDTCVDVYSFLCSSELTQTVSELVSAKTQGAASTLKQSEAAKVICILSQLVDKFFEDAAMKLNLKSLESFSSALCFCSQDQLFPLDSSSSTNNSKRFWWHRGERATDSYDTLLLDFAGEILLKSIRSGRPLFHVIRIWEIIVFHLMKAACHKDLTVSRKAIKHIHDSINAALTEHPELSHFCTTEMLFKPFENLLGLELCETDIQDQIVSCICEFVEANFREIRSGWRPLFGALRATSTNLNTLLDVFRVFLEIENVSVFSYAAVDYILCLLKHLKVQSTVEGNSDFGFETLKYLKRCQSILSSMYAMPQGVKFNWASHIQVSDGLLVDSIINNFEALSSELADDVPPDVPINADVTNSSVYLSQFECKPSLDAIDRPSRVLHVWFLLLEGMHSAAISANSAFQPSLLNMLYEDLGKLIDDPGPIFGLIVFNRIVLPMAQSWLRQLAKIPDGDYSGLKQSTGLLSDLVLQYFDRLYCEESCQDLLNLLLSQVLLLLSECSVHPVPAVARIGPPCIRHIILNVGGNFKAEQWKIVTTALYKLGDMSLKPLCQLMVPFSKDSEYYYGDTGQVKVAVRQSVSPHEVHYTNQLCHRVFLLDEQYERSSISSTNFDDQKVYTFLVYKNKEDFIRIPIKALVTALQAHQYILQVIADVLLQGTEYKVYRLLYFTAPCDLVYRLNHSVQLSLLVGYSLTSNSTYHSNDQPKGGKDVLPGLMSSLSPSAFARLLQCLDHSFHCALAFDSRPGLKFLVQKVATLQQAANLYRQANTSWTVKTLSLFEYSLHHIRSNRLSIEDVKKLLDVPSSDFEPDISFFLNALRKTFNELCTTYLNIVIANGNEADSVTHDKAEKPLFFLVASQEEDLMTEEDKTCSDGVQNPVRNPVTPVTPLKKPFFLSDFSKDSTSDSESAEKDDDGRPNLQNDAKERHQYERFESILSMMTDLTDYEPTENEPAVDGYRTKVKDLNEPAVPPEIEQQRRHSFLKDSEALKRVWTQMLSSVFELLRQTEDEDFQKLLPVFIDGVRRLMAHLSDPALKKHLSDFFQRIAMVYGFGIV